MSPPSPSSTKADIFMSIRPEPMGHISSRAKTHEFRRYLLPASVRHIWFYTTAPHQRLQFVAEIGAAKTPGEIDAADAGIGNDEFNSGGSGYAYEVLHLYELGGGLSLVGLKEKEFAKGPPQKYQFVKQEMLDYFELDKQKKLF